LPTACQRSCEGAQVTLQGAMEGRVFLSCSGCGRTCLNATGAVGGRSTRRVSVLCGRKLSAQVTPRGLPRRVSKARPARLRTTFGPSGRWSTLRPGKLDGQGEPCPLASDPTTWGYGLIWELTHERWLATDRCDRSTLVRDPTTCVRWHRMIVLLAGRRSYHARARRHAHRPQVRTTRALDSSALTTSLPAHGWASRFRN
jgi:hypothetical protein